MTVPCSDGSSNWRVSSAINLKLVSATHKKGFDVVPLAGRTVARQLAHVQRVHSGWLEYNGARLSRDARPLRSNAKPDRKCVAADFPDSAAVVETFLLEKPETRRAHQAFSSRHADQLELVARAGLSPPRPNRP